ncbi:MAG: metal ABC transporter permease [Planctomycetota bacterium]
MSLLEQQLALPAVQNAFLSGLVVALVAGFVGYFVVIRGLTFAGHALADIGFAGAAGALVVGCPPFYGLLAFTTVAAVAIGLLGRRVSERSVTIGIVLVTAVGIGYLFVTLYHGYAASAYSILFGNILGISRGQVLITVLLGAVVSLVLLIVFRPLLFCSYDPEAAAARGVREAWISVLFLVLLAITVTIAVPIVGALLIFTLLIGPPATAIRLVSRPGHAILLSMGLASTYAWVGMLLSLQAFDGRFPATFYIATLSFGVYLLVRMLPDRWMGWGLGRRHRRQLA